MAQVVKAAKTLTAGKTITALLLLFGGMQIGEHYLFGPGALPLNMAPFLSWSGQSNANGNGSSAALSTTQPFDNRLWNDTDTVALVESGGLETPRSGCANQISYVNVGRLTVLDGWGVNATAISGLNKGTGPYNNAQTEQNEAFVDFVTDRPTFTMCAGPLMWTHGETDCQNGRTAAQYQGDLAQLGTDWTNDTIAAGHARCANAPKMIFTQPLTYGANNGGQLGHATVASGMYDAYAADPRNMVLSHAQQFTMNADCLHLDQAGHRFDGEYSGKCYQRILTGGTCDPLSPGTISCNANVITLSVKGGNGTSNLVVDTTSVALRPNYGFEYGESSQQTDLPVVVGDPVVSGRTVTITLNRNCDTDGRLRYMFSAPPIPATCGPTVVGTPGGNIRNNDQYRAQASADWLWDRMVEFDRPFDSCVGCTPSSTWSFANTGSLFADNSPSQWFSTSDHMPELDSAVTWSMCWWVRGNGTVFNSGASVQWAQNIASHRQVDARGTGTNQLQIFFSSSLSSSAESWTSAVGAFSACASAWCMVCTRNDMSQATADAKVDVDLCAAGTCTEISTLGTFAGTFPSALTTGSRSDFSIGGSSGGGAGASQGIEHTIAHVTYWTSKLTTGNRDSLYGSGTPADPRGVAGGPCHYWHGQGNGEDVGSCPSMPIRCFGTAGQSACYSSLHP